jgi:hypothetical protein
MDIAYTGDMRSEYIIFVGKPEGKRDLGRHERRLEDSIKWTL